MRANSCSLIILSAAHGVNHFYQLLLPVAVLQIAKEFNLSHFLIGSLIFSYTISYALLQVPFGYLSYRYTRKRIIAIGLLVSSMPFILMSFSENVGVIGVLLFLSGIGGAAYHPNGNPLVGVLFPLKRGQAMGFHQIGGSIGSVLSPLIAGLVITFFNWRTAFVMLAVVGPLLAFIVQQYLKEPEMRQEEQSIGHFNREPIILIIGSALYSLALRGLDAFAIPLLVEGRNLAFLDASVLFSLQKAAGIISAPVCGRISDKTSRKVIISVLTIIQISSLFTIILLPPLFLALSSIIFGFSSFGLLAVSDAFLSDITPIRSLGKVFGLNFTVNFLSAAILPLIFGGLIDNFGYNTPFFLLGLFTVTGLIPLSTITEKNNLVKDTT